MKMISFDEKKKVFFHHCTVFSNPSDLLSDKKIWEKQTLNCQILTYLAYAFSSKALQNSVCWLEWVKSNSPSSVQGSKSSENCKQTDDFCKKL